jgi:pimeloyl-ACP methyl ester carboxylesterase
MATDTVLSIADGAFRVRLWSDGAGEPLLHLHGFEGHPGDAAFLGRMAQSRRVVAPEHPGYGDSTGIEAIDSIVDMALYYRQLIEALGVGQVDLVGHSLGGMFAAEVAAFWPHLVRRLVLVAPFGLWLDEAPAPDLFAMSPSQLQRASWHNPEGQAAQQALSAGTNGRAGIQSAVQRAGNLATAGRFLWPLPDRGLSRRLRLITAPTLVILGASDRLIPRAHGDAFVSGIPNARLEVIPDAGHSPMQEQPDAFFAAMDAFLAG